MKGSDQRRSEFDQVSIPFPNGFAADIQHRTGDEAERGNDFRLFADKELEQPSSFLGLVGDHDLGSRFCHADHFGDRFFLVGKDVDGAEVKDHIEQVVFERELFQRSTPPQNR
jgi:hypothetical protein